jgi:hypothetical protein
MRADYSIMVASPAIADIKSSALVVLPKMNALFISQQEPDPTLIDALLMRLEKRGSRRPDVPVYFGCDWEQLSDQIKQVKMKSGAESGA